MSAGQSVEGRDLEALGDQERQFAHFEASASTRDGSHLQLKKDTTKTSLPHALCRRPGKLTSEG